MTESASALIDAKGLCLSYPAGRGGWFNPPRTFRAVDGISVQVSERETVGIVGESGCGKSTLAQMLAGLVAPEAGSLTYAGRSLIGLPTQAWRDLRRDLQIVFQDSAGALDPRLDVATQVREPLDIHRIGSDKARRVRVAEVLNAVGLPTAMAQRFPHELSGGQLQRIVLARALTVEPRVIVLDEPVSALDVSIQAQIVNLLAEMQSRFSLAYVFVSHDLGIVRHVADRVYVMYLGRVVEHAPKAALFSAPRHPYTRALLSAVPVPDPSQTRPRLALTADPPSPQDPPPGCRFHPRCAFATDRCRAESPELRDIDGSEVACWHAVEIAESATDEAAA